VDNEDEFSNDKFFQDAKETKDGKKPDTLETKAPNFFILTNLVAILVVGISSKLIEPVLNYIVDKTPVLHVSSITTATTSF